MTRSGSPDCGLYLRLPADFGFEDMLTKLRAVFFAMKTSQYEKNMHVVEFPAAGNDIRRDEIKGLIDFVRISGVISIIRNDAVQAKGFGADGVLLDKPEDAPKARELLGEPGIIGIACGLSREAAENALKRGADYVTFAAGGGAVLPPTDLAAWCSTRAELQCVIEGPVTNDNCGDYVRAGAGFVEASSYIFNHVDGPLQATSNMLHAIDLALDSRSVN